MRDEWGRFGVRVLDGSYGGAAAFLARARGFERAQSEFSGRVHDAILPAGGS